MKLFLGVNDMIKFSKYFIAIIISLTVVVVLFLHFAPVSFDAFACSGGYSRWVVDQHSEMLMKIFTTKQGLEQNTNFKIISKPEEIANTVRWDGRNVYATLKIDVDGKVYNVNYIGKRYWIEKYDWKVEDIDS